MLKVGCLLTLLAFAAGAEAGPAFAQTAARPTVAVYFEPSQAGQSFSQQFVDSVTAQLVNGGKYSVVDRAHMQSILNEQRIDSSGQVTPATEAQIGRMLGVAYMIVVHIDSFAAVNQERVSGLTLLTNQSYYVAQLNLADHIQIIEVRSGQILQSINDTESATSGTMPSSTSNQAFINDQAPKLIDASASALVAKLSSANLSMTPSKVISGRVLDFDGGSIIVSLKASDGVAVGQMLDFFDTKAVQNPDTGQTITTYVKRGTLQITQVESDYSIAKPVDGKPLKLQVVRVEQ
jgi:hypothetical protein